MNLETYPYSSDNTSLDFYFDSVGPRGKIRKIVRYSPKKVDGITFFNLGFGDADPSTGLIDDEARSNNRDLNKILATVAATVLEFTEYYPEAVVHAKGSSAARTRLYQIGITVNWADISPILHVYGYTEKEGWQKFQKNGNYSAFLIRRKLK